MEAVEGGKEKDGDDNDDDDESDSDEEEKQSEVPKNKPDQIVEKDTSDGEQNDDDDDDEDGQIINSNKDKRMAETFTERAIDKDKKD